MPDIVQELRTDPLGCISAHTIGGVTRGNGLYQAQSRLASATAQFSGSTATSKWMKIALATPLDVATNTAPAPKIEVRGPILGAGDNGVRFLPYEPDRVWYMRLDDAAQVFVTEELTGCDVHVFGDLRNPWVCHANANGNNASAAANTAAKLQMSLDAMGAQPNASQARVGSFIGAEYGKKPYIGAFFVGVKRLDNWTFFGCLKLSGGYDYTIIC